VSGDISPASIARVLGLGLLCLLAGCSRPPVSMALPSDVDPVQLQKRLRQPGQVTGAGGAQLTVVPGRVGDCKGWERTAVKIRWHVDPAQVSATRIEVSDQKDPTRKVFAAAGASGESESGDWVAVGVQFHLVDAVANSDLATYTFAAIPCVQL